MDTENWIGDVLRPKEQRAALVAFADAIGARRKFGEDAAGNPRIEGRHGAIYVQPSTCSPGQQPRFQIYFSGGTKGWRNVQLVSQYVALIFGRQAIEDEHSEAPDSLR